MSKKIICCALLLIIVIATCSNAQTTMSASNQKRLSLNFRDIAVRDMLQLLADYQGINIIISDAVRGSISLRLQDVTWQQALSTILTMTKLSKVEQNNILLIAPVNEFTSQPHAQPNERTKSFFIHYAKAEDLAKLLENRNAGLLSSQGAIIADPRTNTLLIKDTPSKLSAISSVIKQWDIPAKQVIIAARIVNIDENFVRELGIQFGTRSVSAPGSLNNLNMDMPVGVTQLGQFNIAIAKLAGGNLLDLELSALETEGHAKIISNPRLVTANRQTALIESGQEIPYQEKTSSGATNIAFKKAVLSLKVTPEITPHNKILLNLIVNQDKISAVSVNGVPAINTQEVQTQVLVNNGDTVVLGGIYEQTRRNSTERVPFLGSIPGIGLLFAHKKTHLDRRELLIFVTPKVL